MNTSRQLWTLITGVVALVGWTANVAWAQSADASDRRVLATVNGDDITAADIDELLIASHQAMGERQRKTFDYRRLLDKLVNDRLLIQQAVGLGMDADPDVLGPVQESRNQDAMRRYVASAFQRPSTVEDKAVRAFFEKYYWQIELRQYSAATEAETRAALDAVKGGASMDSLAKASSLDSNRYRGGLHNLKYWADVENVLRDQCAELKVGALSEPFPFRNAYSFIRVERRLPVHEEAFDAQEAGIRSKLLADARAEAWERFMAERREQTPVQIDRAVLARIQADSALVLRGEFIVPSPDPVLSLGQDLVVDEYELRRKISHVAMRAAQAPFDSLLTIAMDTKTTDLVLLQAARRDGWLDDPEVAKAHEKALGEALIEAYLGETIVAGITFDRAEFQEYYDEHVEEFRGPPQVRLGTIMVGDQKDAEDIAQRLREGADFDFIRKRHLHPGQEPTEKSAWSTLDIFSDEIKSELSELETGKTSRAFEVAGGWIVFKVKDRKQGEPKSIDDMELHLREIMFQREFNRRLDQHLALLKERSEVEFRQDDINEYFGSE
ncbi:MAG: hypothetical protein DHS20C21_06900 [Gemmatimonadota bacterium]|nr:MAG: hypothetical protein DHS20C21_06900 [Gemmatimonadota bacterium]